MRGDAVFPCGGYMGKMLRVDLSEGTFREEELDPALAREFLGGRALGARLLYSEQPGGVDPLGPDNRLIFLTGPLTGTLAPSSARFTITTRSPQTGIYLYSICSGDFGPALKQAGYDGLIVQGQAPRPVYLKLLDGKAELVPAEHLWGRNTGDTQRTLRAELPRAARDWAQITCIGPAGERLSWMACVMHGLRAAGRGGPGAVMGSKKLKAIVVGGEQNLPLHDFGGFMEAVGRARAAIAAAPFLCQGMARYGSAISVGITQTHGIFPVRNWQRSSFAGMEKLRPENYRERYVQRDIACPTCPVACSKLTRVPEGPYRGAGTDGPEYETIYAFGSAWEQSDLAPVIEADRLCDEYGLDTISCGVTLAFAMECAEKGLIDPSWLQDMPLQFGRAEAVGTLIRQIALRQGLGDLLADGARAAAERIGGGSADFAMHCKGMELGGYDPRGVRGQALVFACGPRGGCHHGGGYVIGEEVVSGKWDRFSVQGKGELVRRARDFRMAIDSAVYCAFLGVGCKLEQAADMVARATGWEVDAAELLRIAERGCNVERLLNVREGIRRAHDTLPPRLLREALPDGPAAGQVLGVDLELLLDEFYTACGWDTATGIPTRAKLAELGLKDLAAAAGPEGTAAARRSGREQ